MIINFGSINIDHVYRVSTLPEPGETLTARSYQKFLGGKGVNQSIAIAKAGRDVLHIGAVGTDGDWALHQIQGLGVEIDSISRIESPTGHAIIYVDDNAENNIVIVGGANQHLSEASIEGVLSNGDPEADWVVLQNETNAADMIVSIASERGYKIAYAAAPFIPDITARLIGKIDLLAVNEGEADALARHLGVKVDALPVKELLVTRGDTGSFFKSGHDVWEQAAFLVEARDTTGAGDTFFGSFMAEYADGKTAMEALRYAAAASALQVTREGAATAIPPRKDVLKFLED